MRAVQRAWGHSSRPMACTARRHLVYFPPDDLGSVCPWDVDRAPCAIHSGKNFRMRGVVLSAVISSVFLCSCGSSPPWVPRAGMLHAPAWPSCPGGCLVELSRRGARVPCTLRLPARSYAGYLWRSGASLSRAPHSLALVMSHDPLPSEPDHQT